MTFQNIMKTLILLILMLQSFSAYSNIIKMEELTSCASDQERFKEVITNWSFLDQIQTEYDNLLDFIKKVPLDQHIKQYADNLAKSSSHLRSQNSKEIKGTSFMNQLHMIQNDCKLLIKSFKNIPAPQSQEATTQFIDSFQLISDQIETLILTIGETLLKSPVCSHEKILELWGGSVPPHKHTPPPVSTPTPTPQTSFVPSPPSTVIVEEHRPYYPYGYPYGPWIGLEVGPWHHHHHWR